jgi:hypothetical protein
VVAVQINRVEIAATIPRPVGREYAVVGRRRLAMG